MGKSPEERWPNYLRSVAEATTYEQLADGYLKKYLAARKVAMNLYLELTEDGNDKSGKAIESKIDREIKKWVEIMGEPKKEDWVL